MLKKSLILLLCVTLLGCSVATAWADIIDPATIYLRQERLRKGPYPEGHKLALQFAVELRSTDCQLLTVYLRVSGPCDYTFTLSQKGKDKLITEQTGSSPRFGTTAKPIYSIKLDPTQANYTVYTLSGSITYYTYSKDHDTYVLQNKQGPVLPFSHELIIKRNKAGAPITCVLDNVEQPVEQDSFRRRVYWWRD